MAQESAPKLHVLDTLTPPPVQILVRDDLYVAARMSFPPPLASADVLLLDDALPGAIDQYLAHLADVQHHFLDSLIEANTSLDCVNGQVAKVAHVQTRLACEFLDAQRSIVQRRAKVDAAVAAIGAAAEIEAEALIAAARSRASFVSYPPTLPVSAGWPPPDLGADLGRSEPVGGSVDRDPVANDSALARMVDGAFSTTEPDGAVACRELRRLLDLWWHAEDQETKAAIDDAQARAAMLVHRAQVDANAISRFAPPTVTPLPPDELPHPRSLHPSMHPSMHPSRQPASALSPDVVDAFGDISHEQLDGVLAHLLDTTEVALPTDFSARAATWTYPAGRVEPSADAHSTDSLHECTPSAQEAFDRFWEARLEAMQPARPRRRAWFFPQVAVSAATLVVLLVLAMVVVG